MAHSGRQNGQLGETGGVGDRWTSQPDELELRRALTRVAPDLGAMPMRVNSSVAQANRFFWGGSAWLGDRYVMKYAWSDERADRVCREALLLARLQRLTPDLPVPRVVQVSEAPAFFVSDAVAGGPLTWELASALDVQGLGRVAEQLGTFMAQLHAFDAGALLDGLHEVVPHAQSTTDLLRERYPRLVDERRAQTVLGWCDWVDEALDDSTAPPEVVVHGDLHGHNQVWDPDSLELNLVVDFGECGLRDPHFDFRYLPGNADSLDLVHAVVDAYARASGRTLRRERIMGWQVLTHLGDALWRTEASVDLPGGGDATSWVDDLQRRLAEAGMA
jgi:aminoglycoside phosphotransferase (APT) family kinase protein